MKKVIVMLVVMIMTVMNVMGQDSTKTTFKQKMQNAYSTVKDKTVSSYNQVKDKVKKQTKNDVDSGASTYLGLTGKEWYEKELQINGNNKSNKWKNVKIAADLLYPEAQFYAGKHYEKHSKYKLAGAYFQASFQNGYPKAIYEVYEQVAYNRHIFYGYAMPISIYDAEKFFLSDSAKIIEKELRTFFEIVPYQIVYATLARIYSHSKELKNYSLAIEYYEKAIADVNEDYTKASFRNEIGELYEKGDDYVAKDVDKAIQCYNQAASNGDLIAIKNLKRLGQPTAQYEQQNAQAQAQAGSWVDLLVGVAETTSKTMEVIDQAKNLKSSTSSSSSSYGDNSYAGTSSGSSTAAKNREIDRELKEKNKEIDKDKNNTQFWQNHLFNRYRRCLSELNDMKDHREPYSREKRKRLQSEMREIRREGDQRGVKPPISKDRMEDWDGDED